MTESYLHILVEAKNEYTGQLASILTSPMYEGIASIYEHAKKSSKGDNLLIQFQELLSRIPNWNTETLEREFQRIMLFSRCDWISDLITAVFVSHTKVLSSIHLGNKQRNIELKVPTPIRFIHTVYVNIAREFWKNPYLMYDIGVSSTEQQRNLRDSENIIRECIRQSIRKLLPVKHIIKEYLGENDNNSIYTEDITSTLSNVHIEQIKRMVEVDMQRMNIANRAEDYTNHIEDDDVNSVLTVKTVGAVPEKVELERSFNNYSADEDKALVKNSDSVVKVNDTVPLEDTERVEFEGQENDNDKTGDEGNDKDTIVDIEEQDGDGNSDEKRSHFSTLSRRLRLLRTHDRPVVKKSNKNAIF